MNKIQITLAFFILLNISFCFGQDDWKPGYVIKIDGDTVYGFVDNRDSRSNSAHCYFRKNETEKTQIFSPEEIFGYRFINSKYFISKRIDINKEFKPVFMEFLIHGKVNVYHYRDNDDYYFIEKDSIIYELKDTEGFYNVDGGNYFRSNNEFIGILSFLFKDAGMQSEIQKCTLMPQPLINIAKEYHERVCSDEPCIIYAMTHTPLKFNFGIHLGLSLNKINFGNQTISDYNLGELLGVKLELENVIDWAENISFCLAFDFHRLTNYRLRENEDDLPSNLIYNDKNYLMVGDDNGFSSVINNINVNINTTAVKIPFTINYNFSKGKVKPYIGGGILGMIVLAQNKRFIYRRFFEHYNQSVPLYHFGLVGKMGSKFKLSSTQSIYLELNYEFSQNMNMNQLLRFTNNLFSFKAGYGL